MITFSKNLRTARSAKGFTQAELAARIGVTTGSISNYEKGVSTPSYDLLLKLSKILEVSTDSLLGSNATPTNGNDSIKGATANATPTATPTRLNEPETGCGLPKVITVDSAGRNNIVMLDVQAAAGLPVNIDNPAFWKDKPAFTLPGYQYQSGDFVCVQVSGDSMHPTLFHQDWLISKRLHDPINEIREGYVHVIVTREGVVAKRLLNRIEERGKLVCQSDNDQYPTYEEPVSNVLEVWKVEGRLSFNLVNLNGEIRKDINQLKADVLELKSKLKDV